MPRAEPASQTLALAGLLLQPSPDRVARLDASLLAAADAHGVTPLIGESVRAAGLLETAESATREWLRRARRDAVVLDAISRDHQHQTVTALTNAGIKALTFKGAALAQSHYAESWLRPRGDVDLLVPASQAAEAGTILERHGCRRAPRPGGGLVTYQARYIGTVASTEVTYDVHWRVADPHAFAGVLDHETLWASAIRGTSAGERWPSPVDSLLIACVHRAAHHGDSDRLLLLCDIDRLARRLSSDEWEQVCRQAMQSLICAVCLRGLSLAGTLLATPVPDLVRTTLAEAAVHEPTARYVEGRVRKVDILRSDLAALDSWGKRVALVREHLFPSREYLTAHYAADGRQPTPLLIPLLYADRIVRGVTSWLRPIR